MARSTQPRISLKRTFYSGTWNWGTVATNDFWRYNTFTVGNLPSFSEFANVFDEYKLNAIKVTYRPNYDAIVMSTANTLPLATMHVCVDPASTLGPAGTYTSSNLNTFLENSGVRSYNLNKPVSVYFKPKISEGVLGTGTAAMVRSSPWIKTTEQLTEFRGFHAFVSTNNFGTTNSNIDLDVFVTYYLSFKNLR